MFEFDEQKSQVDYYPIVHCLTVPVFKDPHYYKKHVYYRQNRALAI